MDCAHLQPGLPGLSVCILKWLCLRIVCAKIREIHLLSRFRHYRVSEWGDSLV